MVDSSHTESRPKKPASSSARSSERESARPRSHTSSPTTVEPSDTHTQTFKSTTVSSSTLKLDKLTVSSSSKTTPSSCLLEETTLVELVNSNPSKSIQVPSRLLTSGTPAETVSQPDFKTLWLSETP